jgi:mono/diheme cytochrome c family protein
MKLTAATIFFAAASLAADAPGQAEYNKACRSCHGADGTPNPGIAKSLKVEMKHLGSAEVQKLSDAQLKDAIVKGIGKMKPAKSIAGKEDAVVAYMRTLKK